MCAIGNDVELASKQLGYEISPDSMPEEVLFIRSDQYSFVLQVIPAVSISDGIRASDPKEDGLAVMKPWMTTRYHTPLDNMDQPLDYDSAAKASGLNFQVGYEIAPAGTIMQADKKAVIASRFIDILSSCSG